MQVYWSHGSGVGDANGIAWVGGGSGGNGDAINGGGYVAVHHPPSIPADEDGASARPHFPLIASMPRWDTNYGGTWAWQLGFAVPEGQTVDAHFWVVTA